MRKRVLTAAVAVIFMLAAFAVSGAAAPEQVAAGPFRPADGSFQVAASLPQDEAVSVQFPVWSQPDQSDIVWHEAVRTGGLWTAEISVRDHGWQLGTYTVHCYAQAADGTRTLIGGTAVAAALPQSGGTLTLIPADSSQGEFTAVLGGLALPADSPVSVRVTDAQGQEAARFPASVGEDGFAAQILAGVIGRDGQYTAEVCFGPQDLVLASAPLALRGAEGGRLSLRNADGHNGTFGIVADLPRAQAVQSVRAAVWTQPDQSDLQWLSLERAGDRWVTAVNVRRFGRVFGTYTVHAYAQMENGLLSLIDGGTLDLEPENYVYYTEEQDGMYSVCVEGAELAGEPLRAAVWSSVFGRDDLAWHDMTPAGPGSWQLTVDPAAWPSGRTLLADICRGEQVLGTLSFPDAASDVGATSLAAQERLQRNAEAVYAKVGTDLHEVYKYVRDNFSYVSRDGHITAPEGYTRQEWYAVEGLETFQGNCYTFASSFYELAKRLGYDVTYVEGEVPSVSGRWIGHGFVLLTVDGQTYICDPVFEHSSTTGRNYYMQPVEKPRTTYRW